MRGTHRGYDNDALEACRGACQTEGVDRNDDITDEEPVKLFFSPLACSMATRIALYEAGTDAEYVEVDPHTKRTEHGADFRTIHPLGLVPALELDDGELLTENGAILQHVAAALPHAELAPREARGQMRLHEQLSFIGTELHKAVFVPLLDKNAAPDVHAYSLAKAEPRLAWLASKLEGRDYVLDRFSVADAYLFTVLNWSVATPIDLAAYPSLDAYVARMRKRPAVLRALQEETALFVRELRRHGEELPSRMRAKDAPARA